MVPNLAKFVSRKFAQKETCDFAIPKRAKESSKLTGAVSISLDNQFLKISRKIELVILRTPPVNVPVKE